MIKDLTVLSKDYKTRSSSQIFQEINSRDVRYVNRNDFPNFGLPKWLKKGKRVVIIAYLQHGWVINQLGDIFPAVSLIKFAIKEVLNFTPFEKTTQYH